MPDLDSIINLMRKLFPKKCRFVKRFWRISYKLDPLATMLCIAVVFGYGAYMGYAVSRVVSLTGTPIIIAKK